MLRTAYRIVFSFLFLCLCLTSFSQQTKWPNTLLWRISSNGLARPSYLYGTMHLQDQRLFQFGDSVYFALEATDGLAVEIDFKELMDSMILQSAHEAEKELILEGQKMTLNRKVLSKSADTILQKFGIKGNTVNKKQLKKIKDYRMNQLLQQGEMPTIVDAYLLGLAQRQDKWTGGIEDVIDQLNLGDELGGELTPEAVLQPDKSFRNAIEQMIVTYVAQDLTKIDAISSYSYSAAGKDLVLINRNLKMARRMDSLAHQRPTLFAVGAAHLPGDSGVITSLRRRGFTVSPVFSATKTPAASYASHLKNRDWFSVEGDAKAYVVRMPGTPTDYNMFGDVMKMKMFFDITTMTFYLSGNVSSPNATADKLDEIIKNITKNFGDNTEDLKAKTVFRDSLRGKEATIQSDKGSYRIQLYPKNKMLYMLMVGGAKKSNTASADAEKFFASFAAGNVLPAKNDWSTFALPQKAFSVRMPGKPSANKSIDEAVAQSPSWRFTSYNSVDQEKGLYYLVQVRELHNGYYMQPDSSYFDLIKSEYRQRVDRVDRVDTGTYKGYPVLYMDAYLKKADANYRNMIVVRGNRVYALLAGATRGQSLSDIDSFFTSLTFLDYEPVTWPVITGNGFSTTAPSTFTKVIRDSDDVSKNFSEHYRSYDESGAVSYEVYKNTFSPTYWSTSDSTYFTSMQPQYLGHKDSLVKKEWVQNGDVKGLDLLIKTPGYNSVKKLRLLVNADTLYTIMSMIPEKDLAGGQHEKFFNGFRLAHEVAPTIYTPKPVQLLQALQATDSATFADAKSNLDLVTFSVKDLPMLHQSLLQSYQDGEAYTGAKRKLADITASLADSTTLTFVTENYPLLTGAKEAQRYSLLALLAKQKTKAAYDLLKKLLLINPPAAGNPNSLRYALMDSLQLTATLFPELLQKADDSLLGYPIMAVSNRLLDSNLLNIAEIKKQAAVILKGTEQQAMQLRKGKAEPWELVQPALLVTAINSKEGNAFLQRLLSQKELYLKQTIILGLLKNNVAVSPFQVNLVAADKSQRGNFYGALQKIKKESLFPALYASQKSLAESELYNLFLEDYEDFSLAYTGLQTVNDEGENKIFYLFTVRLSEDGETKHTYLAVAGPYDINTKERLAYSGKSGFYSDESFQPAKVPQLLKAYLARFKTTDK